MKWLITAANAQEIWEIFVVSMLLTKIITTIPKTKMSKLSKTTGSNISTILTFANDHIVNNNKCNVLI